MMTAKAYTESFAERLRRGAELSVVQKKVDDETILRKLRAVAELVGRTPGSKTYDRMVGYHGAQTIMDRFGSWANACRAAGLEPNARPTSEKVGARRFSDADLERAYRRIRAITGRPPTVYEWDRLRIRGEEPAAVAMRKRYRRWTVFLQFMEDVLGYSDGH